MTGPSSDGDLAIRIRDLVKVYARRGGEPVRAVDGLDLDVARGEVFGLLGPNGAGKTTTVEICEGLTAPTSGEVQILGLRWGQDDDRLRMRIGVSLQETKFIEKLSVHEILQLFASFYDEARSVDEVCALVGLEEKSAARSTDLSGGQRQRLAVATALVGRPELLFLDEPTTGLDPGSRRGLWDVVRAFRADGGTVLLTTHYMEEAAVLCDRIGIVDHGRRIALGSPDELVASLGASQVVELHLRTDGSVRLRDEDLARLPGGVARTVRRGDGASVYTQDSGTTLPALIAFLDGESIAFDAINTRPVTLEDVFVELTGRGLDGEGAADGAPAATDGSAREAGV